ncbi:MAG: glycosyltransferase family 2 protein [Candidatus Omnitrophota bacterium]|jgi:glycosyltransferase involved in cell wall biosynthesis
MMNQGRLISIIVPFYNEELSLNQLYQEISKEAERYNYELVFVDDGSADKGGAIINELMKKDKRVRLFTLRRNMGKSMALNIGFQNAQGDVVITMDADLQDDPREVSNFIKKIDEGYDLVNGWKINRKDPLEKKLASGFFNKFVSLITGIKLHDFNCGFKAYRKCVIKTIKVYGEMHRFIPILANSYGFIMTEIPVHHNRRSYGKSKFGSERYLHGFFDFLSAYFLLGYSRRPFHFIGVVGLLSLTLGSALILYSIMMKFCYGQTGIRPAFFAGLFFFTTAIQIIMTGFVAELVIYGHQKKGSDDSVYIKEDTKS